MPTVSYKSKNIHTIKLGYKESSGPAFFFFFTDIPGSSFTLEVFTYKKILLDKKDI